MVSTGNPHPSGFFDGITRRESEVEETRASDSNENQQGDEPQKSATQGSSAKVSKKSKLSKTRSRGHLLVFREGIGMEKVALTESMVLVGKVHGRNYSLG